jgi:hypothetical protein
MPDLATELDGDFTLTRGNFTYTQTVGEAAQQNMLFRLQTDILDYQPDSSLGVGLHQFIGRPNTRALGAAVQSAVIQGLTRDGVFSPSTLRVDVVPLGKHMLGVYIFHRPAQHGPVVPVTLAVTLSLISGTISLITG